MKPKYTLILLAVAAGLYCYIRLYESKHNSTQQTEFASHRVAVFDSDDIDGIFITNNEGRIELRREGTIWRVTSPVKDHADFPLVHGILTGLEDLQVIESFEADGKNASTPSLKDLGLEAPNVRVKLFGKGEPQEILIGKDTPVDGQMYVRLDGSNKVCVVSNALKSQAQKKTDDFRDHRLLGISPAIVNRLDVKSPAGEIEVLRDHGAWYVNKPLKARADAQKITDLIAQTVNTQIDTFLPENGANLASYGLAEPRGSIALSIEGSNKPAVLEIGQPVENDRQKVYAKLSTRESIYILPEKINDVLFIKPNDVRDKFLMELNLDMVDRIHIEAANKPKLTIARKGEDWILKTYGDVAANSSLVKNFVNYLRSMKVSGFVSDVASDLPKYGLDKPPLRVTFSSYASENTAETTAGEDTILSLAFGKTDGDLIYARLENEPYVVSLPRLLPGSQMTIFDAISSDPVYWQDVAIFKYKPEEIVSLEITRDGQTIDLERGENAVWKLKQGQGEPNQIEVQSLINTLSSLHAVRTLGSSTSGLGFEKSPLVISFITAGNQTGKLTVGSQNEEAMWNAQAEGRAGAFLIGNPDYQTLRADLTAPAASPVETGSGK